MSTIIAASVQESVFIAGRTILDVNNLILLVGSVSTNKYTTLRKPDAAAGYQVPTGKVFRFLGTQITVSTAAAGGAFIGYADNDLGLSAAGPPTNPLYPGLTSNSQNGLMIGTATAAQYEQAMKWDIPVNKYLFGQCDAAGAFAYFKVWGREV